MAGATVSFGERREFFRRPPKIHTTCLVPLRSTFCCLIWHVISTNLARRLVRLAGSQHIEDFSFAVYITACWTVCRDAPWRVRQPRGHRLSFSPNTDSTDDTDKIIIRSIRTIRVRMFVLADACQLLHPLVLQRTRIQQMIRI